MTTTIVPELILEVEGVYDSPAAALVGITFRDLECAEDVVCSHGSTLSITDLMVLARGEGKLLKLTIKEV